MNDYIKKQRDINRTSGSTAEVVCCVFNEAISRERDSQ
tara:strand:+ start:159 stop:272 length:114 start_codon:yes stop_codon:yes gene_type:complete